MFFSGRSQEKLLANKNLVSTYRLSKVCNEYRFYRLLNPPKLRREKNKKETLSRPGVTKDATVAAATAVIAAAAFATATTAANTAAAATAAQCGERPPYLRN